MQKQLSFPNSGLIFLGAGIFTGVTIAILPYLLPEFSISLFSVPVEAPYLLAGLLLLIATGAVLASGRTWKRVHSIDLTNSFVFFLPIFILIFMSGFRLQLSPQILLLYIVFFAVMAIRGRITEIVITPFLYFVILHLIFCNLSLLGPSLHGPAAISTKLLTINVKILMVFLILNAIKTEVDLNRFIRLYIVLSIITSIIALSQVGLYFIVGTNYSFSAPEIKKVFASPIGLLPRVTALFSHPNLLATDISPLFIMLSFFLVTPGLLSKTARHLTVFTLGIMLIPIFFSCSRGTWVAVGFGLIVIFFVTRPDLLLKKLVLFLLALTILWLTGVIDLAYDTLVEINSASVSARLGLFSLGLLALKSNPVLGFGWGNFASYSGNTWGLSVHNVLLQVMSETGIVGFITYFAMIGYVFRRVIGQIVRTRNSKNRTVLEAYLTALVTLMINNMFHQVAWSNFSFILLTLGEAITRIVRSLEDTKTEISLLTPDKKLKNELIEGAG